MIAGNLTAPNTIRYTLKKDNKVVATETAVVSHDGKELTETIKGTNPAGKPFTNVIVYTKENV